MAKQGRPKTGSIKQRGPYQFFVRYTINGARSGMTFESREQAQAFLDSLEQSAATGRQDKVVAAHRLTVGEALLKRLELKHELKSFESEQSLTNRVLEHCSEFCAKGLYAVKTEDILDFIALRKSHYLGNASINRELSAISNTFTVARSNFSCVDLNNPVVRGVRLRTSGPQSSPHGGRRTGPASGRGSDGGDLRHADRRHHSIRLQHGHALVRDRGHGLDQRQSLAAHRFH